MNYYELLEIEVTATITQIKAAYRKKAKEHHPDHGGDPEVFKEIQQAYECLTDSDERAFYDRVGFSKASELMSKVASMIRESINSPNPIAALKSALVSARADCNIRIRQFDDRTLKLAKKRDSITKLNSKHKLFPVFISVIDAELNNIAQQKQSFEAGLQEIAELERMFAGLVDEKEDAWTTYANRGGFVTSPMNKHMQEVLANFSKAFSETQFNSEYSNDPDDE